MSFPFFIARRLYAKEQGKKTVSRPAIRIATTGVAVGLAVMIVSLSVIFGFKNTVRNKVSGFGSHVQVTNFMSQQSQEEHPICINDSLMRLLKSVDDVSHIQRYAYKQGILKTDEDFLGVMLKGIGPEFDSTFIHQHLLEGHIPTFSDQSNSNRMMVSKTIADKLKLRCGDRIFAYFIGPDNVKTRRFTITGIYQTNFTRFDENICLVDLYTTTKLNKWGDDQVSGAEIMLDGFNHIGETAPKIAEKINKTTDQYGSTYSLATIQEVYPQIFSWLDLLDLNVWIILGLMICVAGVTMTSGLLIIILERTSMIGMFKALGAKNHSIRRIFLWFAAFIIGKGLVWGNIIGIGLCLLQHFTGLVHLDASTYYVNTVPIEFNIPAILLLNIATLLACILVLIAPSYLITYIHPAKTMHFE